MDFSFSDEQARRLLFDSKLPQGEIGAYIELLHRGGAIVYSRKDSARIYLSVQPGNRLSAHQMSNDSGPDPLAFAQVAETVEPKPDRDPSD